MNEELGPGSDVVAWMVLATGAAADRLHHVADTIPAFAFAATGEPSGG